MKHLFIILKKNAEVAKNFLKLNLTAVTAKRKAFNNFFFVLKQKKKKVESRKHQSTILCCVGNKRM